MIVKIILGDDLRRLGESSSLSWVQLPQAIQDLFGIQGLATIRYEDDEKDQITIASDGDFREAVKLAQLDGRPSLKLHVSVRADATTGEAAQVRLGVAAEPSAATAAAHGLFHSRKYLSHERPPQPPQQSAQHQVGSEHEEYFTCEYDDDNEWDLDDHSAQVSTDMRPAEQQLPPQAHQNDDYDDDETTSQLWPCTRCTGMPAVASAPQAATSELEPKATPTTRLQLPPRPQQFRRDALHPVRSQQRMGMCASTRGPGRGSIDLTAVADCDRVSVSAVPPVASTTSSGHESTLDALLAQLYNMGFTDLDRNIQLLFDCEFDLQKVVDCCFPPSAAPHRTHELSSTNIDELLATLSRMGFTDMTLNLHLLQQHGFDMQRVINRLLTAQ